MKILIVVTHLLGSGHLRRSINLAQEFVACGHEVTLVSGGLPVKTFDSIGFTLVQLPPVSSDGTDFSRLLDQNSDIIDEHYLQARENKLCSLVTDLKPDVLITELFPFGRRMLRDEFLGLLQAAHTLPTVPVILSSVRDILATPSSDKKIRQTERIVAEYYDHVVVHSNAATTPLSVSWPVSDQLQSKLYYTGYVGQSGGDYKSTSNNTEVVVSAGGGSVGRRVYETAVNAARLTPDLQWRILVGGQDAQTEVSRLQTLAKGTATIIEANRPDFRELLCQSACSVSMSGYNTVIDLLLTGTPGVLIPFDAGGEKEQTLSLIHI